MVLRTIGPRITGPWDLGCLGSKVRGPKVRGSKALGLIILEPFEFLVDPEFLISQSRYNPTWHCIVGRNFGSYVTHETRCVYFQPFSEI